MIDGDIFGKGGIDAHDLIQNIFARQFLTAAPWMAIWPSVAIIVLMGFNLLGDGLNDALDPRDD